MKKIIRSICLISLLVFTACFKNEPILEDRMSNGEKLVYDSANQEYYTGALELTKVNKGGAKYIEESYEVKEGRKHGRYKMYSDNGKLGNEGSYKDGKKDGLWKSYNYYGELRIEGSYKNDKKDGLWKEYDIDGKLEYEKFYKNDGKDELWKRYDSSGKLSSEASYENGKRIYLEIK